jgi:hypothetical protein
MLHKTNVIRLMTLAFVSCFSTIAIASQDKNSQPSEKSKECESIAREKMGDCIHSEAIHNFNIDRMGAQKCFDSFVKVYEQCMKKGTEESKKDKS